jgi:thiol-disulfide isomerase/thioredoxin
LRPYYVEVLQKALSSPYKLREKYSMRYFLLISILIPTILFASPGKKDKNPDEEGYLLNGIIEEYDSGIVYMQRAVNYKLQPYDTTYVVGGKFQFSGYIEYPELFYFQVDGRKKKLVQVFLENSEITLQFHLDRFNEAFVSGSAAHDKFMQFEFQNQTLQFEQNQIQQAYSQAANSGNIQQANQLRGAFAAKGQERLNFMKNFVQGNRQSPVIGFVMARYMLDENLYPFLKEEHDSLVINHPESKYTEMLGGYLKQVGKLAIGAEAPNISAVDTSGVEHSVEDFRGKILLIDFWASWCGPCRRANPQVVKLYNTYKDQGFDILGVSLDKNAGAWKKAIIADKLTWTHISDLKGWSCVPCKDYKVSSIPQTFLLDRDGKIVGKGLKGPALEAKLKELLAAEQNN